AAEVHALVVQRDVPLFHAGHDAGVVDLLGLRDVLFRVGLDVGARARVVEGDLLVERLLRVVLGADDDLRAEAASAARPEEPEHRRAHAGGEDAEPGENPPVEELPPREPDLLVFDGDVLDGCPGPGRLEGLTGLLRPGPRLLVQLGQPRAHGRGPGRVPLRARAHALARLTPEAARARTTTPLPPDPH